MIRSMTGYAICKTKSDLGDVIWEIRSVNQRYLEIFLRLPDNFRSLEFVIRERLRSSLSRGKIECSLRFESTTVISEKLVFNKDFANQLIDFASWIKSKSNEGEIDPLGILRWPGVLTTKEQNLNNITKHVLSSFEEVLRDFILTRETEGKSLRKVVEERLEKANKEIIKLRSYVPEVLKWQRDRLTTKLRDAEIQLESSRFEQELLLLAQRIDINEELDRLEMHIKTTFKLLRKGEVVGRHLDFIMQELNREANTIASKSINSCVTNSAIELKILIEQMREQIQNIE